jgi:hypothetical protein
MRGYRESAKNYIKKRKLLVNYILSTKKVLMLKGYSWNEGLNISDVYLWVCCEKYIETYKYIFIHLIFIFRMIIGLLWYLKLIYHGS